MIARVLVALVTLALALTALVAWRLHGPGSLRARYRAEAARSLARDAPADTLREADLARLPEPVRRYLRFAGAVGQPRVREFRVRLRGRIRAAADAPWMPLEVEQTSVVSPPRRLFFMHGAMKGVPFAGLHRFADGRATMRVELAGLAPVADAAGREMDHSETVTHLNDLCVMAPGALVEPAIAWREVDSTHVEATYTVGAETIRATLAFDVDGRLVDFVSDDRAQASRDGRTFRRRGWATPLLDYRAFGPLTLASRGLGVWQGPDGPFTYLELEILDVQTNPGPSTAAR